MYSVASKDRDVIALEIRCDELNVDLEYLSAHPRKVVRHSDVAWPQELVDRSLRPALLTAGDRETVPTTASGRERAHEVAS